MNSPRITLLDSQAAELSAFLDAHPSKHERGAIVLFRRLGMEIPGLERSDRYLAVEIIPFNEAWVTTSSPSHVAFELKNFRELFRKCEEESLVFGFVHNHPGGPAEFSSIDDDNEQTLLAAVRNRNGSDVHLVALLWAQGVWKARVRHGSNPGVAKPARHVAVVGRSLVMHVDSAKGGHDEVFARQAAAFGQPFATQLQSLRVAVVGAGGTGSPVITLLARSGVGEIVVIDGDTLERSNLNRVRGAGGADVGEKKAQILKRYVDSLQLPVCTAAIDTHVDQNAAAIDALASCDVIFGCTDDQIGREILTTSLYFHAQAYVDMGLGGQVSEDTNGRPYLRYHYGRISTILPESGECLFCQGVIKDTWIRHQYAVRQNPDLTVEEARERYLQNGGEQAPGVGPFTSAVADYAVATLFDLLQPFRKFPPELRRDFLKIDFVRMEFSSSQEKSDPDCVYCRQHEFLLNGDQYRLGRPALGRRNVYV